MKYTVLLTDNTIGEIVSDSNKAPETGEIASVTLHDENGNPVESSGTVEDILLEKEL